MTFSFLISEVAWRQRLEPYLSQPITVFREALTNNHYEGDVKGKASLKIISFGELSYGDYTGADITFQDMTPSEQTLLVDQVKYTAFAVEDPDQTTTEIDIVNNGSKKLAYQISRMYDDYLASLYTEITTNVYGAAAGAWSSHGFSGTGPVTVGFNATAGEVLPTVALANINQMLAESNADLDSPRIVLPPWFANFLFQELGLRWTLKGDSALEKGARTGLLDMPPVSGFSQIYSSNLVANTNGTAYQVMCGTPDSSITFASHLEKIETLRLQAKFATGVRALTVFGAKIPFEGHMGLGIFNQGSPRTQVPII